MPIVVIHNHRLLRAGTSCNVSGGQLRTQPRKLRATDDGWSNPSSVSPLSRPRPSDIGDIPVLLNTTDGDLYVKGAALPAAAEQGDFIVSGAGGPHDWIVLSPPGAGGDYSLQFAAGVWTFVAAKC